MSPQKKIYLLLTTMCIFGYAWVLFNIFGLHNSTQIANTPCIFKHATGIACPSCGSTRSLISLIDGRFSEAISTNPLGILLFIVMAALPLWLLYDFFAKRSSLYRFYLHVELFLRRPRWAIPAIFLILLNWGWNIFKGL